MADTTGQIAFEHLIDNRQDVRIKKELIKLFPKEQNLKVFVMKGENSKQIQKILKEIQIISKRTQNIDEKNAKENKKQQKLKEHQQQQRQNYRKMCLRNRKKSRCQAKRTIEKWICKK
ncbi:unnamed protein product [Paramecium octaurelia]|uniref:Uncharacterized protein n=1 Tax=Paramecium octaurelia TaxID=43137 RepID=A0A8S1WF03_PAROT|nr:unnamed protein product [Paramecium octaurelia]CAD8188856.1 unnamed protein product [Paramecium octaurelia]